MGPRDPVNTATERQQLHLAAITAAGEALLDTMHAAEGTTPPGQHQEHTFQSRRMNIAATHLETALMYARKAALEAR